MRVLYYFMKLICKNCLTFGKFCDFEIGFIWSEIVVLIMFLRCENEGEIGSSLQILSRNRFLKFRCVNKYSAHNVEQCRNIICNLCPTYGIVGMKI